MGILIANYGLKKKVPAAPPPRSVQTEGQDTLNAFQSLYPQELKLQSQAAKDYTGLSADLLEQYGPRFATASMTPEAKGLYTDLNKQASEELAAGSSLTPSLRRELEQYTRAGQASRGFGFSPNDLTEEVMTLGSAGQELQARRRAFAQSVLGFDQQAGAGATNAILGRAPPAPDFSPFNPYAADVYNTDYNAAWSNKFATQNYNAAMLAAGINFDAALVGGGMKGAGCWVAREVFGEGNALWRIFQGWLLEDGPAWVRWLYLRYGERIARWLRDKPRLKRLVRTWMAARIRDRLCKPLWKTP